MLNNIFRKTLYERRWMLIAWSVGIFAMTLLTMSFFPFFKNSGFEEMFATAPKSLQGLLGDAASYKTVQGYVDQQIFALRLPLLTIIMAVSLFLGIGVADEDRGTMETLLAQPISRTQVFWQKFAAGAVILGVACLAIMLAVIASFPIAKGTMGLDRLLAATFGCWLISLVFGALTYAVGAITGKRGLTIGLASAVAFVTYLISSMAPAVDKLASAVKLTPFYYYNSPSITKNGLDFGHVLVLLAIIGLLGVAGYFVFNKRDLVRD